MGNQMFQLAFAHAASRRLGTEFVMCREPGTHHPTIRLWRYFELGRWANPAVRWRARARFWSRHGFRPELVLCEQHDDPAGTLASLRDGVEYSGFFQSEDWFSGYAGEVRGLFTVRAEHRKEFRARFPAVEPYICMHVRRADYVSHPAGLALPTSYFLEALESISDRERYRLVVVSDDPEAVRRELGAGRVDHCSQNPAIIDLQLLMNAQVVITSNSSFSWWGAWLNQQPGARVIAPRHWLGFRSGIDEPARVIPARWVTIPVRDPPLQAIESGG
jgi:hypothetical protein